MKPIFHKFLNNIAKCFWGFNFLWHFLAFALTYVIIASDFDWIYFISTRNPLLQSFLFPAVLVGAFIPIFGILIFLAVSLIEKNAKNLNTAYALGQAAITGWLISSFYKMFTGRPGPSEHFVGIPTTDISHIFHFGILRNGVFFGWPSTHTTIAFAMALTLIMLYPKNKIIKYSALAYAFYVGIGVSTNIHWFSDFVAGAILGSLIGVVIGKSFLNRRAIREN